MNKTWDRNQIIDRLAKAKRWANSKGYICLGKNSKEHILKAELALGRSLPAGVEVHHFNGVKADNANTNLVICENRSYHTLLHRRRRIQLAGGNPNVEKICCTCLKILPLASFHKSRNANEGRTYRCTTCANLHAQVAYRSRIERKHTALIESTKDKG